ncbi:MAG: ATP-binding protein, partial [Candidatus Angelobacter sp.]
IDLSFGRNREVLKLEQNLYVSRTVESEIVAHISQEAQSASTKMVLIVGEAGCGKTSLLWHLYETLARSEWEPWILKSALLSRRFRSGDGATHGDSNLGFDRARFSLAIRAILTEGRRPVLLLDTADLLLHEEGDRDFILDFLRTITDQGCWAVVTCRHQEAKLLRPLEMKPILLGAYDQQELLAAVEKHVHRFYGNALDDEAATHLHEIQEAVAGGLPLREVCASPLMLRMLFLIYAPDSIPNEIHAFRLYEEYWNSRVKKDLRAGSLLHSSENLDAACCVIALTMLSEGTPELDETLARNAAEQNQISHNEIEALISRGVLRRSESETVSFFHQTFFEHGAARGMVRFFGETGIGMLESRMSGTWSDLFCAPVYEQALLLAESIPGPVRETAGKALSSLLANESMTARTSGIYVYCHSRKVTEDAASQMAKLLASAPNPLVDHFLHLAPNVSQSRFEALFYEMEVIWRRGSWPEQEYTLLLLERLAFRKPEAVKNFLDTHQVLFFVLQSKANNVAERKLARVLMVLARAFPTWSLQQFIALFNGIFRRTNGTDAPAKILVAVAECASFLRVKDLGTRFDAQSPSWHGERVRDFVELARAYGHLWFLEWQSCGTPVERIVLDIRATLDTLRFAAKLEGLAELVMTTDTSDCEEFFTSIFQETVAIRRGMWVSVLLKRLMIGNMEPDGARPIAPASAFVRKRLVSMLLDTSPTKDCDLASRIRRMMHQTILSPSLFGEMFSAEVANSPQIWSSSKELGELLPEGYIAKHPAALEALEEAKRQPAKYNELLSLTRTRIGLFVKSERRIAEQFLILTFLIQQTSGISDILPGIAEAHPQLLQHFVENFRELRRSLMASPLGKVRRAGVTLWQQMLHLELAESPRLPELFLIFDREEDEVCRSGLLLLMALTAAKSTQNIRPFINKLGPLTESEGTAVRVNSCSALISAVSRSRADAVQYGPEILEFVLRHPTDSRLAGQLGYVLDEIRTESPAAGLDFFRRILFSDGVRQLGIQSKRTLSYRFRSPARALARVLNKEEQRTLVGFILNLDYILGSIVLDAISHEHFATSVNLLDELLSNPNISAEIKEMIRRTKYTRERTVGGHTWPELFAMLS